MTFLHVLIFLPYHGLLFLLQKTLTHTQRESETHAVRKIEKGRRDTTSV